MFKGESCGSTQRKFIHNTKAPFIKAEGYLIDMGGEADCWGGSPLSLLFVEGGCSWTQYSVFPVITYANIPSLKDRNVKQASMSQF